MLSRQIKPLALAIGLLPIALLSFTWEGSSITQLPRGFQHMPVSDFIAARTTPNDTIFTDQIGRLLIETNRNPGSRSALSSTSSTTTTPHSDTPKPFSQISNPASPNIWYYPTTGIAPPPTSPIAIFSNTSPNAAKTSSPPGPLSANTSPCTIIRKQ